METTFAEILEMRRKLDAALVRKAGRKLAAGFDVKVCSFSDDMVAFTAAFHKKIETMYHVGGDYCKTPQEAFDSAMNEIEQLHIPSVDDEIKALQDKIDALKS